MKAAASAAAFIFLEDALLELVQNGALSIALRIGEHIGALRTLLEKCRDTPMSLAEVRSRRRSARVSAWIWNIPVSIVVARRSRQRSEARRVASS
jgi:hypothetical protein